MSAATESMTMTSTALERTSNSQISIACSPVSGWLTRRSSSRTPSRLAHDGSSACSASMNAATPPAFCALAIMWSVRVVLPEDSGPKISSTRPRGTPDPPSAMSSDSDPVAMPSTVALASPSNFMTAPLPNCFSICCTARLSAESRAGLVGTTWAALAGSNPAGGPDRTAVGPAGGADLPGVGAVGEADFDEVAAACEPGGVEPEEDGLFDD